MKTKIIMANRRSFFKNISLASLALINQPYQLLKAEPNTSPKKEDVLLKIIRLIKSGDDNQLSKLFKKNPGLRSLRDERDRSLIWLAALYNQPKLFPMLSEGQSLDIFDMAAVGDVTAINEAAKSDVTVLNRRNKFGYTPLLAACECGQGISVESLVAIGARMDVMLPDDNNNTPLTLALQHPNPSFVEWMTQILLGNGINPQQPTKDGNHPLHYAVLSGNVFATKMLLRKRADSTIKDKSGKTPLSLATEKGKTQIVEALQDKQAPKDLYITRFAGIEADTALNELPYTLVNDFVTVAHFSLEKTQQYLKRIPDLLNTRATWDELAIEGCTHLGNEKVVTYLLEKGAPYSICTATMLGDEQKIKSYLASDKNSLYDRGPHDFPLIWYVAIGKPKMTIAEMLVHVGADVNATIRGRTVLSECANRGHAELMDYLLSKGANAAIASQSIFLKGTPYEIATRRKNANIIDVLKKYGVNS